MGSNSGDVIRLLLVYVGDPSVSKTYDLTLPEIEIQDPVVHSDIFVALFEIDMRDFNLFRFICIGDPVFERIQISELENGPVAMQDFGDVQLAGLRNAGRCNCDTSEDQKMA